MRTLRIVFAALSASLFLTSCDKDDAPAVTNPTITTGVYVLSEGNSSPGTSMLTFYDLNTKQPVTDFYANANNSKLGIYANDMLAYGSKLYIVVNGSNDSYVEVANVGDARHIKKVDLVTTGGSKRQPRYAVAYKNKVLVSSWDGTVAVIDTTALTIDKYITVGSNPEQMAVAGDKLYVTNSGGLQAVQDSTISVVDLISQTEITKVVVGLNPNYITADNNGFVYVASNGNYWDVGPKLTKVSTATNTVTKAVDTAVGKMIFHDGLLYTTGGYLGSQYVRALNTTDFAQVSANFITDGTQVTLPYGIAIDPENDDVYITDGKDYISSGEVFCFDKTGKKKFSFSTSPATLPNTVVFIKK